MYKIMVWGFLGVIFNCVTSYAKETEVEIKDPESYSHFMSLAQEHSVTDGLEQASFLWNGQTTENPWENRTLDLTYLKIFPHLKTVILYDLEIKMPDLRAFESLPAVKTLLIANQRKPWKHCIEKFDGLENSSIEMLILRGVYISPQSTEEEIPNAGINSMELRDASGYTPKIAMSGAVQGNISPERWGEFLQTKQQFEKDHADGKPLDKYLSSHPRSKFYNQGIVSVSAAPAILGVAMPTEAPDAAFVVRCAPFQNSGALKHIVVSHSQEAYFLELLLKRCVKVSIFCDFGRNSASLEQLRESIGLLGQ